MKILNFGSCNIDYVYSLDHIVRVGETETTHKLETFPGGKGLNQSIAVARAGAKIYHAGCVGNDGAMLLDILANSGVDISHIRRLGVKNGHAVIQLSSSGENSIFLYPGSNEMIDKELIDKVLCDFGKGDIILLQNEISNVGYIIEKAYKKGMCIIFNPAPFNDGIRNIDFNMISYIVLNEVEAAEMSGFEEPEKSLEYLGCTYPDLRVVLTLGENGCVYMDREQKLRQAAFSVDVADTTAAGDTFTGYFAAGLSRGDEVSDILKTASAASAIAVSRSGAAPSIPEREEVMAALEYLKVNSSSRKNESLRKRIDEYIGQNLKTAALSELAGILGYSSVYTGELVKKLTGKTFAKLLQSKRCAVAAELLVNSDLSVKEIIESVGYENESFFREIFKERYGKKPLEYRKSARGE